MAASNPTKSPASQEHSPLIMVSLRSNAFTGSPGPTIVGMTEFINKGVRDHILTTFISSAVGSDLREMRVDDARQVALKCVELLVTRELYAEAAVVTRTTGWQFGFYGYKAEGEALREPLIAELAKAKGPLDLDTVRSEYEKGLSSALKQRGLYARSDLVPPSQAPVQDKPKAKSPLVELLD